MQTLNVVSRVNVHTLRPVFHRFLSARSRVLEIDMDNSTYPQDIGTAFQKTRELIAAPDIAVALHIHRMVPFETTDPGIRYPMAILCIARENASGGFLMSKTNKVELFPGQLTLLPEDPSTWYISAIGEIAPFEDAYVDVVWFSRSTRS